jgi:high frequency lysogenization protein
VKQPDPEQVLALAAVFQAGLAADRLASQGRVDEQLVAPLLNAITALDPDSFDQVFPRAAELAPGLELLSQALGGKGPRANNRALGYALGLIQIANLARRDNAMLSVLRNRLEALEAQLPHFPDRHGPEFSQRLAGIYVDTLGTLRFRIRVQGNPRHLQDDSVAARIRALFLGGVRAAFLWHQQGGRRWRLMLGRRRYLQQVEQVRRQITP